MVKIKSYCLLILLGFLLFFYYSCQRTSPNSLKIVSINSNNDPLIVDVKDWYVVSIEEEDTTYGYLLKDWVVPVELSYYETGIGLPTYPTPYTARCTSYTVIFQKSDSNRPYARKVRGATNIVIESNVESKVKTNLKVIPIDWQEFYLGIIAPTGNDEPGIATGPMVKATLIINGYEELTRNPIVDTGYFTINFGDYWDNPREIGAK